MPVWKEPSAGRPKRTTRMPEMQGNQPSGRRYRRTTTMPELRGIVTCPDFFDAITTGQNFTESLLLIWIRLMGDLWNSQNRCLPLICSCNQKHWSFSYPLLAIGFEFTAWASRDAKYSIVLILKETVATRAPCSLFWQWPNLEGRKTNFGSLHFPHHFCLMPAPYRWSENFFPPTA